MKDDLRCGTEVGLSELLSSRDVRVQKRHEILTSGQKPTITLTLVIPGAIKDCPLTRAVADVARAEVIATIGRKSWPFEILWSDDLPTGSEALFQVDCGAVMLKHAMVQLEDSHPLGRLWDLDIHDVKGLALSRKDIGDPPRRCLLCDDTARACGRSRKHTLDDLWIAIEALYDQWLASSNSH